MRLIKIHIILILLIFLGKNLSFSQERFCVPTKGWIGHHVVEYDSSYLAINIGHINYKNLMFFHKISKKGDSLDFWQFKLDTNYGSHSNYQRSFTNLNRRNYIAGRALDTNINKIKGVLTKFNQDYTQRIKYFNFFYEAYTSINYIVPKNTTFIVNAEIFQSDAKRYASLMEIDTNGNRYQWKCIVEKRF